MRCIVKHRSQQMPA